MVQFSLFRMLLATTFAGFTCGLVPLTKYFPLTGHCSLSPIAVAFVILCYGAGVSCGVLFGRLWIGLVVSLGLTLVLLMTVAMLDLPPTQLLELGSRYRLFL